MGGPLEGWLVASKRLVALPRIHWGALGRGWGREGSGALRLARAAAVSTGLRVRRGVARDERVGVGDDGVGAGLG